MPMWTSTRVSAAGPVGDHFRPDEELAGVLEGVVVPLPRGPEVLGAAVLAEGLQDGGDRRRALGGQVAADPPGTVHRRVQVQVPVGEAAAAGVVVGVGLLRPPGLVRRLGEDPQIIEVRPGRRGVEEDLVGLGPEFLVVDAAGPPGDLPRPRHRHRPGGRRGVEVRVAGQQPHLADGGLGVLPPQMRPGCEPGGAGGVPVGVVAVVGVEPPQDPVGGGAEQRRDRAEGLQGLAAGGAIEVMGGRGVQVRAEGAADAERVRDAAEAAAGAAEGASRPVCRAHAEPPPPGVARLGLSSARATTFDGGHQGGAVGRCRGLPATHQITSSTHDNQIVCQDHLFDSCRLRHRQDAELGGAGHRP
jgi:hypothetical protein